MNKIILNGSGIKLTTDQEVLEDGRGRTLDSGNEEDDIDPFIFWPSDGPAFLLYGVTAYGNRHFVKLK